MTKLTKDDLDRADANRHWLADAQSCAGNCAQQGCADCDSIAKEEAQILACYAFAVVLVVVVLAVFLAAL